MRQLLVFMLIIMIGSLFSSPAFADIQTPISTLDPSTIFTRNTNVDNGLDPVDAYVEYGTDGSPTRVPIAFDTLPCNGSKGNQCHFPTNKWYTDIIFKARALDSDENFKVGQSPYTIRLFDDVFPAQNAPISRIPGIYVSINDPYVVVAAQGPSIHGFYRDTYVKTLQLSEQTHFAFSTKIDGPNKISNDVIRTLVDHGPLHLTTRWTHQPTQGTLTTWLVRGSPYVTVQYQNMPVTLFEAENIGFVAMGSDTTPPFIFSRDINRAEAGISGQIFRFVMLVNDEAAGSTDPNSGKDNYSYPIRYVEYMLFTDQPITLAFQPTTPTPTIYQLLYSKETPSSIVVRAAYVGSGQALDQNGQPTRDVAIAEDYVLANVLANNRYQATETMLTQYANIYPTGSAIDLESTEQSGKAIFNWQVNQFVNPLPNITNAQLLMLGFQATHKNYLTTEDKAQAYIDNSYAPTTIRGNMFPIAGKIWTLNVPYGKEFADANLWYGSNPIPAQYLQELSAVLKSDAGMLIDPQLPGTYGNTLIPIVLNDSYGFGKEIARLARLAVLAQQLNDTMSLQKFLIPLKQYLSLWFDGGIVTDPVGGIQNYFNYDKKFGGIVTARASFKPGAPGCIVPGVHDNVCGYDQDYYSGQYTDHHFHFGYFIYAAAVLGQNDPDWLNQYKEKVNLLVRDLTNPSSLDPYFTPYRYFDWFEGHAYANGLVPGGSGRNQESTSEGLNAWYAVTLWGDVTQNDNLKNIGRLLASREILAAQKWTQISPGNSIYDPFIAKANTKNNTHNIDIPMNEGMVTGINWANKIDHGTFFGTRLIYMTGIQMMPYTPFTSALFSSDWLQNVGSTLTNTINDRLALMQQYKNFSSVINYFADEWPGYLAAKGNSEPIDQLKIDFWGDLQGIPKDTFQWSIINALALAPVAADTAYKLFAQNSNGDFYNAMITGENGFEIAGLQTSNPVVKYYKNCTGINNTYPDACFHDIENIDRNTVVPYFSVDYNIIDRGMSLTNSMWWIFNYKKTPPVPSLYWSNEISIDRLTGATVTVSWQPPIALPASANVSFHYVVKIRGPGQTVDKAQCEGDDIQTCSIAGLTAITPYLITITAIDRSTTNNRGSMMRTVRIYTQPDNIVSTIVWPGDIQYKSGDPHSIDLQWQVAMLDPPIKDVPINFEATIYTAIDNQVVGSCPVSTRTVCTISNLQPYTNYYATVAATAEGKAQEVDKTTIVFQTLPPKEPFLYWSNPTVTATPTTQSVNIVWDAATLIPPNAEPINYNAVVTNTNNHDNFNCSVQNDTSCTIDNLSPGNYQVTVTASAAPNLTITTSPVNFTINALVPSLTWPDANAEASLDEKTATISWTTAYLENGTGTIQYQAVIPGTSGCTTPNLTCHIDVSQLAAGEYTVSLSASSEADKLTITGPTTTLSIPASDYPTFTVCKRTTIPRIFVTFSSAPSDIQSWNLNDSTLVSAQMVSPIKYVIDLENIAIKPENLTITYPDGASMTQSITYSGSCE